MVAMNRALQRETIGKLLDRAGIARDTVDIEAHIDPSLHLNENIRNISDLVGKPLTNDQVEEVEYADDDYIEEVEQEMLENGIELILEALEPNSIIEEDPEGDESMEPGEREEVEREIREHEYGTDEIFQQMVQRRDVLSYLSVCIAPEIVGKQYDQVRKGVLLALASHGQTAKRSRIHVLLAGPPGTGKTEVLRWLKWRMDAKFVDAPHTTKVGLVGDARGEEITPGVLAQCDGRILCIDELDKMSHQDQFGLLEAMEEGEYTITKGKHYMRFPARVVVIASVNDITQVHAPLLDRFDFVYTLEPPSREERAEQSVSLVKAFFGKLKVPGHIALYEFKEWIADYEPQVRDGQMELIEDTMKAYINMTSANITEKSYRVLEMGILRTATAIAKLQRREIEASDVVKAIELRDDTLNSHVRKYLDSVAKGLL